MQDYSGGGTLADDEHPFGEDGAFGFNGDSLVVFGGRHYPAIQRPHGFRWTWDH